MALSQEQLSQIKSSYQKQEETQKSEFVGLDQVLANMQAKSQQQERKGFLDRARERFTRAGERATEDILDISRGQLRGEQGRVRSGLQAAGSLLSGGAEFVFGTLADAAVPQFIADPIKAKTKELLDTPLGRKGVEVMAGAAQGAVQQWEDFQQENPRTARDLKALVGFLELYPGSKVVSEAATGAVAGAKQAARGAGRRVSTAIEKAVESLPETAEAVTKPVKQAVIKSQIKQVPESVKNRLKGKSDLMEEFISVVKKRNIDDTAPSPLAFAAQKTEEAVRQIEDRLSDVGSEIGSFRQKLGTLKASPDSVQEVIDTAQDELSKMGLRIGKNRKLVEGKGRTMLSTPSEVAKLQEFVDDLFKLKSDPSMVRLIDVRDKIGSQIKFAKSAKEVSGRVDPFSRSVRSKIAEINRALVGKTEAKKLERYSDLSSLVSDFRAATTGGRNVEYFLKRILSERDRLPTPVFEAIKKETGIDLRDYAQMSKIVTELLGNPDSKSLFRQQITGAGLDAAEFMRAGVSGKLFQAFEKLVERLEDPEAVLRELAK